MPRLSIVEVAPFEAISSVGVRASDGRSAWRAGRKSVDGSRRGRAGEDDEPAPGSARSAESGECRRPPNDTTSRNRSRRKAIPKRCRKRRDRPRRAAATRPPRRRQTCRHGRSEHAESDEVRPLAAIDAPQASSARRMSALVPRRRASRRPVVDGSPLHPARLLFTTQGPLSGRCDLRLALRPVAPSLLGRSLRPVAAAVRPGAGSAVSRCRARYPVPALLPCTRALGRRQTAHRLLHRLRIGFDATCSSS